MEQNNPFGQFVTERKEVQIEALNNAVVVLQQPTVQQANEFSRDIFNGKDEDGTPKIDYSKVFIANITKISVCMIEPKMTVEELSGLANSADKAIAEIIKNIDNWNGDEVDEEGNENL
ncbi:MAG: hypothetical protein GQ570_11760 [Helicobacteraceae bacterium]|nr:hypothetical protein [Helicobacteraceae bacterium]